MFVICFAFVEILVVDTLVLPLVLVGMANPISSFNAKYVQKCGFSAGYMKAMTVR